MEEKNFSADISMDEILQQNEAVAKDTAPKKRKIAYDPKHYLDTIMKKGMTEKSLTIRLLPFSPEGGSPFHKIYMHTVRCNTELSASGWKLLVCPKHNGNDNDCPFCQMQESTREKILTERDEAKREQLNKLEFANKAREFWVVRCIDRDKEEEGVKFWAFPHSRKADGIYDKIITIFKRRKENGEKKGKLVNIFSLENGRDLEVTIKKDAQNKSVYTIVDSDDSSPLNENPEVANAWINDTLKWDDVYVEKPYQYLELVLQGKVPFFDKEKGIYVEKKTAEDYKKEREEKEAEEAKYFEAMKPKELTEFESKVDSSRPEHMPEVSIQSADDDLPF